MIGRACLVVAALAACGDRQDVVASSRGADAGVPASCTGNAPVLLVAHGVAVGDTPDATPGDICTGTVAVRTFPHALCTCEGFASATALTTDSFDSTAGPYAPGGTSGDVGLDGELATNAVTQISGGLTAAGAAGATLHADLHVAHDLAIGGPLGTGVAVTAGGNARIAGNVDLASLAVAGTLTAPAGATLGGAITAGTTVRAPVAIAPPCACDADQLVDIAAFVAGHAAANDDAAIGLQPTQLTGYHGDLSLDLPCGIYYVGPVHGDGALTVRVTGRVALLVDGAMTLDAPLTIALATDDAELDLLIGGTLSSGQAVTIGRPDHPSRTRVYIAGTDPIQLSGDSQLAANLYAPRAALALSAQATVFGSLFVRRLDQAAPLTIHYDVDVRRADVACPLGS
ncbi:MAG TPA: hypothetical protein VFP84_21385 [Kofleriaceae bacterium]|nr:hypothetical protein [Kofleriaceae bacterium]